MKKLEMLAKTLAGLEEVLKKELIDLGAEDVTVVIRGVRFKGTLETLYKANFCCRTALRVLLIIGEKKVKNATDLYDAVSEIDWSEIFLPTQTFSVNSTVNTEAFNNSMFVSLKAKDAIVDQFRKKFGKRPSVNIDNPDIRIHVHASSDTVSISLDSSGDSLHKRGYRSGQNEASMSEVLASGIILLTGWDGKTDFYDPMCGSGTLPIEAALIARNIPPGIFRTSFAFESWKDFNSELFEEIYNSDYEKEMECKIYASDISSVNVKISSENAKNAGLKNAIEFSTHDFATLTPRGETGIIIVNPPYGQRMNDRMIEPLYNMIGERIKSQFIGFTTWVFSGSEDGFKSIGLKHSTKIELINGSIDCTLRSYESYKGSKKLSKAHFSDNQNRNDSWSKSDSYVPRERRPVGKIETFIVNDPTKRKRISAVKPKDDGELKEGEKRKLTIRKSNSQNTRTEGEYRRDHSSDTPRFGGGRPRPETFRPQVPSKSLKLVKKNERKDDEEMFNF